MANLKEVRNRITSVTSTQQITSAMKMVSAAKLRRAQDAIVQMRPYAEKLKEILGNLSSNLDANDGGAYSIQREERTILMVLISSNRGLAGAFNTNVIKMARQLLDGPYAKQLQAGNVQFITIGKKVTEYVIKNNLPLISSHNQLFEQLSFENVAPVAIRMMEGFLNKEFDKVEVLYNGFKNAAVQLPTVEQFLPVENLETAGKPKAKSVDYLFEPDQKTIVEELIPKSLKIQLYKAILDSNAAEHGARMTAMNKATENAKDLIKELKLSYNKARQASITNEILEIVGGAEALNG